MKFFRDDELKYDAKSWSAILNVTYLSNLEWSFQSLSFIDLKTNKIFMFRFQTFP